jgi:hypothetical protein
MRFTFPDLSSARNFCAEASLSNKKNISANKKADGKYFLQSENTW